MAISFLDDIYHQDNEKAKSIKNAVGKVIKVLC